VSHGVRAWAREDHGEGPRAGHGHSGEGAGAALRTYWRACRGLHKPHLQLYVATYAAMVNAKRVTPALIHRLCQGDLSALTSYT
jgi:hypothetical protein